MGKILWFDCETTGLDPYRNGMIQIAALVEIDGEIKEELNLFLRPLDTDKVDQEALDVNGHTDVEIWEFPPAEEAMVKFQEALGRHVDKFDKSDKFVMAGYFVRFDMDFLRALFVKLEDRYFGSWFFNVTYDVQALIAERILRGFRSPNYKLVTMCREFGIEIDAHDALSDIKATRTLDRIKNGQGYCKGNCRWADNKTQVRNNRGTKLNKKDIQKIRELRKEGKTHQKIADTIGCSRPNISIILEGKTWN